MWFTQVLPLLAVASDPLIRTWMRLAAKAYAPRDLRGSIDRRGVKRGVEASGEPD